MKIGLTGSIACGKSTVSSYLRTIGYTVVDADAISREITAPGGIALPALRDAFGSTVFFADGTLNRRMLANTVFGNPERLAQLNAILHPMIIGEIVRQLHEAEAGADIVFGDVPLLFECGMEEHFQQIWVVCAPQDVQIARLFERDGLSQAQALQRIQAQMPQAEKIRRADAVISTEGSIPDTQAHVRRLLASITTRRPE